MDNYNRNIMLFCDDLKLVYNSGIFTSDALRIMAKQADKSFSDVLNRMADSLDKGNSFAQSIKEADYFDAYLVKMIEIGEQSGYLEQVFNALSTYYHRLYQLKNNLKDAITYPCILVCMMLVVLLVLIIKVLPLFDEVLKDLGTGLSGFSLALMDLGGLLAKYGLVIIMIIILVIAYLIINTSKKSKNIIMYLSNFSFSKKLSYDLEVSQLSYALSMLFDSGYEIEQAFKLVLELIDNKKLKTKLINVNNKLDNGENIENALIEEAIFKGLYNQMIILGFKAGKHNEVMSSIAIAYEDEVNKSINKFLNIIEPALVASLAMVMCIILISVILPLISIMDNIG